MSKNVVQIGTLDRETGWWVTDDEAYLPEEWAEASRTCLQCEAQFVIFNGEDPEPVRGPSKYCGEACAREAGRERGRQWWRDRKAASLELAAVAHG